VPQQGAGHGLSRRLHHRLDHGAGIVTRGARARQFKFARQKSKLAGTIRGSYFVIKGEY